MNKLQALRDLLQDSLAELAAHPEKLQMFATNGNVKSTAGGSLSFSYGYNARVIVLGFSGNPDALMLPIIAWLRENQPDVLDGEGKKFTFEVELVSHTEVDIQIDMQLDEAVKVSLSAIEGRPGSYAATLEHLAFPPLPGEELHADTWELLIAGEVVASWDAPLPYGAQPANG